MPHQLHATQPSGVPLAPLKDGLSLGRGMRLIPPHGVSPTNRHVMHSHREKKIDIFSYTDGGMNIFNAHSSARRRTFSYRNGRL